MRQTEYGGNRHHPTRTRTSFKNSDLHSGKSQIHRRCKAVAADAPFDPATSIGPMARGERNSMGPTVVLDTGRVEIVVISNHVEPHDLAAFFAVPP